MERHGLQYLTLIAANLFASTFTANGAGPSALEVRCGVVYSLHTRSSYGGWTSQISSAMGTGWPDMLMMGYAPFVAVTNHASGPMTLTSTARVEFDQPNLGIRLKRVGPSHAGFVNNLSIPLSNLYVNANNLPLSKRFGMSLFAGTAGEGTPSGSAVVAAGQTLVFSPWMPSGFGLEQLLDWNNSLTSSISCVPGWKGSSNGYYVNWITGMTSYAPNPSINGSLGIIATRSLDQWDVEVKTVGNLAGCRVFGPQTAATSTWPWDPDPSLEVTSFPFNYSDSQSAISTNAMSVGNSAALGTWPVKPVFSVVLPPATTQLLIKDPSGDGVDDDWQQLYFSGQPYSRNADPDGDGYTNLFEFLAGTSPVDAQDFIRTSLAQENGDWRLEWSSAPQRTYVVESSEDLTEWTPIATVTAQGSSCNHSLGGSLGSARYFRLQIVPPI